MHMKHDFTRMMNRWITGTASRNFSANPKRGRGADDAFLAAVAAERELLLTFYRAGLHAYEGNRELWQRDMQRVMMEGGRDPYYSRFGDGNG